MKKVILWTVVATLFTLHARGQQDTQVSQYIFNGIYANPAYTGYKEDLYVQSYFRSQWVGITGAPKSFALAVDGSLNDGRVGLGFTLANDQIGAQSLTTTYANYAYRIRIGEDETSHLGFGLAFGMMQLGLDGSKLMAITPGDQAVPTASQVRIIPDANFGLYYANANYFAGFSATNVLAGFIHRNTADYLVPIPQPHFYLTAGTLIPINDEVRVKPIILIKDDIKGPTTLDIDGFVLMNERLSFGAFYRTSVKLYPKTNLQSDLPWQNAFGGIVEFFATPAIRIGYSYDHSLNALGSYNYGSHEFSIGFYLNNNRNGDRSNGFRCYKF
jgi:type IX secretion system PorP/SprF family membrane protein